MALGATRWQVLRKVVVPGARTGLLGAFTLATGRALGETVAVAHGDRQLALHRPLAQVAGRHHPLAHREQLRRGDRHRAGVAVRRGLVLLVIGVGVNAAGPGCWCGRPRRGVGGTAAVACRMSSRPRLPGRPDPRAAARRSRPIAPGLARAGASVASTMALGICWAFLVIAVVPLVGVIVYVVIKGLPAWNADFFTHSTYPEGIPGGGIFNAIVGHRGDHGHRRRRDRALRPLLRPLPRRVRGTGGRRDPFRRGRDDRNALDHHRHLRLHRHRHDHRELQRSRRVLRHRGDHVADHHPGRRDGHPRRPADLTRRRSPSARAGPRRQTGGGAGRPAGPHHRRAARRGPRPRRDRAPALHHLRQPVPPVEPHQAHGRPPPRHLLEQQPALPRSRADRLGGGAAVNGRRPGIEHREQGARLALRRERR